MSEIHETRRQVVAGAVAPGVTVLAPRDEDSPTVVRRFCVVAVHHNTEVLPGYVCLDLCSGSEIQPRVIKVDEVLDVAASGPQQASYRVVFTCAVTGVPEGGDDQIYSSFAAASRSAQTHVHNDKTAALKQDLSYEPEHIYSIELVSSEISASDVRPGQSIFLHWATSWATHGRGPSRVLRVGHSDQIDVANGPYVTFAFETGEVVMKAADKVSLVAGAPPDAKYSLAIRRPGHLEHLTGPDTYDTYEDAFSEVDRRVKTAHTLLSTAKTVAQWESLHAQNPDIEDRYWIEIVNAGD